MRWPICKYDTFCEWHKQSILCKQTGYIFSFYPKIIGNVPEKNARIDDVYGVEMMHLYLLISLC